MSVNNVRRLRLYANCNAKAQVTVRYQLGAPIGLDTIVLSTQHSPELRLTAYAISFVPAFSNRSLETY